MKSYVQFEASVLYSSATLDFAIVSELNEEAQYGSLNSGCNNLNELPTFSSTSKMMRGSQGCRDLK